jgi:hypothetical protein
MGIEIELAELLVIQLLASNFFARFDVEKPAMKKIVKWLFIDGITVGLFYWLGHWAAIFPIIALIPGTIYHFNWCKKNGIDPLKATPKIKYYQLRGWRWEE